MIKLVAIAVRNIDQPGRSPSRKNTVGAMSNAISMAAATMTTVQVVQLNCVNQWSSFFRLMRAARFLLAE